MEETFIDEHGLESDTLWVCSQKHREAEWNPLSQSREHTEVRNLLSCLDPFVLTNPESLALRVTCSLKSLSILKRAAKAQFSVSHAL